MTDISVSLFWYDFQFWKQVFTKFKAQKERRIWDNVLIKYEFEDVFTGNDVVDKIEPLRFAFK